MTLHGLVRALGGDLYQDGRRANVPAPGHSPADRSVSLWLTDGRLIIHGFGSADWRAVRDDLRARGLIDGGGRLIGGGVTRGTAPRPDPRERRAAAAALWDDSVAIRPGNASDRHLQGRAVRCGRAASDLRHHPRAPISVYRRAGGPTRAALVAGISDPSGALTAVELTYLAPNGDPAPGLRLGRKAVGVIPPGSAVRLCAPAEVMLVGEGVVTTLSAIDRFGLPGWALLAANNLASWSPPDGVRSVLIAADRGQVGETAAARLRRRLRSAGIDAEAIWPDPPFWDWNEVATDAARAEAKEGRGGAPERRGSAPSTGGRQTP